MNRRNTAHSCYMCTQDSCKAGIDPDEDCGCSCHGDSLEDPPWLKEKSKSSKDNKE